MKKSAEILSTICFVGLGFCIAGACLDYFDWLVALVMFTYLALGLLFKHFAKSVDTEDNQ